MVGGNYGVSDYERLCCQSIAEVLAGKKMSYYIDSGGQNWEMGEVGYLWPSSWGHHFFRIIE